MGRLNKSAGDKSNALEDHTLETHNPLSLKGSGTYIFLKDKLIYLPIEHFGEATKMVGLKQGRGFLQE